MSHFQGGYHDMISHRKVLPTGEAKRLPGANAATYASSWSKILWYLFHYKGFVCF